MTNPEIRFVASPDIDAILNALIDKLERRPLGHRLTEEITHAPIPNTKNETIAFPPAQRRIKVNIHEISLPAYFSQIDPQPRLVANHQAQELENLGLLRLAWQAGEKGNLLETVSLDPQNAPPLYRLIRRTSTMDLRARLESQLLGDRFRFHTDDWRTRALHYVLAQIKAGKSPAPFSLSDMVFNEDLLTALAALDSIEEETPFRVFSVHAFNDSKRFYDLKQAVVQLARRGQLEWKRLPTEEILQELNLVPNPSYLFLSGPWDLVDADGQQISLAAFNPSVGLPATQAARMQRASVRSAAVICIENLTTFHSMTRSAQSGLSMALLCLMGNPSPACRSLLTRLVQSTSNPIPLYVWADLDYGGLNILAQLRKQISPAFMPFRMGVVDLDTYHPFARPLTHIDRRNLERLRAHPELQDMMPVIDHLLRRGLKLEQEAIPASIDLAGL